MIVSKNGTSYDTSDGSEQPHAASASAAGRPERSEREEINRWEDDGPGPHSHTAQPDANSPSRPAWSVLPLRNLLEAIRQLRSQPTEAAARQGEERAAKRRLSAEQDRRDAAAAAVDARQDPYRNAWENT